MADVEPKSEGQSGDERPLPARSVVASLLLGRRDARLAARSLVRSAGLLGVTEGTTRVALSRMLAAGELTASDGQYTLAGPLLERHQRQETGRYQRTRPWDGTWRLIVLGTESAGRAPNQRTQDRRLLARLRFAEWREGVWIRPDNLDLPEITVGATLRRAHLDENGIGAPALARKLWPLEDWARQARTLLTRMTQTVPEDDLGGTFRVAAVVVRHLRDDPLLPEALVPEAWPGDALRSAYDDYEARFSSALLDKGGGTGRVAM